MKIKLIIISIILFFITENVYSKNSINSSNLISNLEVFPNINLMSGVSFDCFYTLYIFDSHYNKCLNIMVEPGLNASSFGFGFSSYDYNHGIKLGINFNIFYSRTYFYDFVVKKNKNLLGFEIETYWAYLFGLGYMHEYKGNSYLINLKIGFSLLDLIIKNRN